MEEPDSIEIEIGIKLPVEFVENRDLIEKIFGFETGFEPNFPSEYPESKFIELKKAGLLVSWDDLEDGTKDSFGFDEYKPPFVLSDYAMILICE